MLGKIQNMHGIDICNLHLNNEGKEPEKTFYLLEWSLCLVP